MAAQTTVNVDLRRRVGYAWREIRRGASAVKVRELFYSSDDQLLDQALADTLGVICQRGPMRMGDLAEALHITPASTTRAVSCLADKGYVQRVRNEHDQRSVMVEATLPGRERYGKISARIQRGLADILNEFTPEEQVQLAEYLDRFVAAVDKLAQSDPVE